MLTQEENDLLTRTDSGTPCGELMRRYWQPAAISEELPPGEGPLPVRLLGEDLVMFRDNRGRPGLLGIHCSHRGANRFPHLVVISEVISSSVDWKVHTKNVEAGIGASE